MVTPLFFLSLVNMFIGAWNIRGLNDPLKQAKILNFVKVNNLCCVGILETKMPMAKFNGMSTTILSDWKWIANYCDSHRGRIWIGWDPKIADVTVMSASDQFIHAPFVFCL